MSFRLGGSKPTFFTPEKSSAVQEKRAPAVQFSTPLSTAPPEDRERSTSSASSHSADSNPPAASPISASREASSLFGHKAEKQFFTGATSSRVVPHSAPRAKGVAPFQPSQAARSQLRRMSTLPVRNATSLRAALEDFEESALRTSEENLLGDLSDKRRSPSAPPALSNPKLESVRRKQVQSIARRRSSASVPVQEKPRTRSQVYDANAAKCVINFDSLEDQEPFGEGGASVVYSAFYQDEVVAVKVLKGQQSRDDLEKFQREVSLMCGLEHPNIVKLIGCCSEPLALVLEFVEGSSLFDLLHDEEFSMTWLHFFKFSIDIARGMLYLHSLNIIHRDLKPLNILVSTDFTSKICDFGFSRSKDSSRRLSGLKGTYQYMAPEMMVAPFSYDERADIYSYGIILWETATRDSPFEELGKQPQEITCALTHKQGFVEQIARLEKRPAFPAQFPPLLRDFIQRCWNANPAERPSFAEISEILTSPIAEPLVPVTDFGLQRTLA
eukprot:TRINITY_DN651_c0_g1_i2.p1 TRINITY_DN651_c0_g1~~TRINITY_DN651_c0_g1_i2.p1  ORF type:complete len:510 (-),score=97.18 TRINITY_DN651_c0_g1_i2:252-1748(-)